MRDAVVRAGGPLIRLGTKFATLDEFVARFAPFVTATSVTMPAVGDLKVGAEGRFVIQLADSREAMTGRCRVEAVNGTVVGAPGRPVMRLGLLEMDEASRSIHQRLLAAARGPATDARRGEASACASCPRRPS